MFVRSDKIDPDTDELSDDFDLNAPLMVQFSVLVGPGVGEYARSGSCSGESVDIWLRVGDLSDTFRTPPINL